MKFIALFLPLFFLAGHASAKFELSLSGGYGMSFSSLEDATAFADAAYATNLESNKAGPDFTLGFLTESTSTLLIGAEMGLIKSFDAQFTTTDATGTTITWNIKNSMIPILFQTKIFLFDRLFLNAGAGFSFATSSTDVTISETVVPTSLSTGGMTFMLGGCYSVKISDWLYVEPRLKMYLVDFAKLVRVNLTTGFIYKF